MTATQTAPKVSSTVSAPMVINPVRLFQFLFGLKGATPTTIMIETDPSKAMRKTSNPYYGVIGKRCRMNGWIGFEYANSVNRVHTKEGNEADFVPSPRKWGEKIPGTCIVQNTGKKDGILRSYVEFKPNGKPQLVEYFNLETGEIINTNLITPFLYERASNAAHQGVSEENEVFIRDVEITNIKEMKVKGRNFIIR